MKSRAALVGTFLFLATILPVSPTHADPIVIEAGSLIVGRPFPETSMLDIRGTHGFAMRGIPDLVAATGPWQCLPCDMTHGPNLVAFIGGSDFLGTVEFEGKHYQVGIQGDDAQILLFFEGGTLPLPPLSPKATVSGPFTVNAELTVPGSGDEPVNTPVVGRGTATIDLVHSLNSPTWEFERIDYAFGPAATPVPEPGTFALVASALIGAAFRRPSRRRLRSGELRPKPRTTARRSSPCHWARGPTALLRCQDRRRIHPRRTSRR